MTNIGEENGLPVNEVYPPVPTAHSLHIRSESDYEKMYKESISEKSDAFWAREAKALSWTVPFRHVHKAPAWFVGGKLNACYNAVDRWAETDPHRVAVIAEGDEPGDVERLTFLELQSRVCRMANLLKIEGQVRKGDVVTVYMPTVPELLITMLACARIGAVHSVVFAGFSAPNLAERIADAQSRVLVCQNKSVRGGRVIDLLAIVEQLEVACLEKVLIFDSSSAEEETEQSKPTKTRINLSKYQPYCPVEDMDSEDLLFLLYTSGSTGKPKGIAHTTGGYLLYASMTHKYIFDVHPGDVWACMADLGWITGHTYGVYGPLINGNSTLLFDSIPTYPTPSRYWECVARHKITHFYTAPTAIRTLMKFGPEFVSHSKAVGPDEALSPIDLSSLRILGSVGEPINPEAWRWYYSVVGRNRCPIMDTYWQTETGGIVLAPLACRALKPGSATRPFFGIEPVVIDPLTGRELEGMNVAGFLAFRKPWPGMVRTILGDHDRMEKSYFVSLVSDKVEAPVFMTGDGCVRDQDGYFWITGRVDDVIKVSGHRMGSAEIEHALVQHPSVSESAVVGFPHPIKGEGLFCYVVLKNGGVSTTVLAELRQQVRNSIGPVATPDIIIFCSGLPKTRSGKIMRRILRKLAHGQGDQLGDVSTLADPAVVDELQGLVSNAISEYLKKV